jgi:hypothetical protein
MCMARLLGMKILLARLKCRSERFAAATVCCIATSFHALRVQCIARDLRKEATFKLVFDIWHERASSATDVVLDVLAGVPDASTLPMNTNSGVDPEILRELIGLLPARDTAALASTLRGPSQLPQYRSAAALSGRASVPTSPVDFRTDSSMTSKIVSTPFLRAGPVLQTVDTHGLSAIDAIKRIEAGLHLENVLDRHRGVQAEFPDDSREARGMLMVGIDMDVDMWDTIGESLPAAQLWKSSVHVVLQSDLQQHRHELVDEATPEPARQPAPLTDSNISVFRVRVCLFVLLVLCCSLILFCVCGVWQVSFGVTEDKIASIPRAVFNAAPLKVQLSMDFINELIVFFDPMASTSVKLAEVRMSYGVSCRCTRFLHTR